jgi:hypothetical protein
MAVTFLGLASLISPLAPSRSSSISFDGFIVLPLVQIGYTVLANHHDLRLDSRRF